MYRSSKKPARKNRTGFCLNPGHPFGRLPNGSGTATHEQYTTCEPEKSSPPGKKSPQRVKTAPIPRRARRRAVFTRCGQWESGGGTKQGTGSPAAQPRASPEPPAGAAGTGGAQGRSHRKRTRPHATCRVRFTFFGLSTGRRKPHGGGHAAEPAHGKAPRKTRPKASPRRRGRAEKTPRGPKAPDKRPAGPRRPPGREPAAPEAAKRAPPGSPGARRAAQGRARSKARATAGSPQPSKGKAKSSRRQRAPQEPRSGAQGRAGEPGGRGRGAGAGSEARALCAETRPRSGGGRAAPKRASHGNRGGSTRSAQKAARKRREQTAQRPGRQARIP